jgi:hypothetical protein
MATTPRSTGDAASSLRALRRRIEALAVPDGAFVVVATDEAVRPVPACGLRFDSRATAREAARLTAAYRRALRRYDAGLPRYEVEPRREPRGRQ